MNLEQKITNLLNQDEKELKTTLCLLLVAVTAAVYWQVAFHEFVNYDDQMFVFKNPHVYTGLTLNNIKWAFTTLNGDASYWHPFTWLSLQLDCQLFGLRPGMIHLTNLLFHLANTALLFIVLDNLTGKVWRSLMVAVLFALHPLHIETVAWVSERKSLTCAFFWLLATWAYIGYVRRPGLLRYFLVLVLYAASLMSKPFAVTLPFTLLLLDFWPLDRLRLPQNPEPDSKREQPRMVVQPKHGKLIPLIREKLPFLALAVVASWLTILAQADLGALSSMEATRFIDRMENCALSYCLYLRKLLWPVDLAPIYPLRTDWAWWQFAGCGLFLICVSLLAIRYTRQKPWLGVGWFWYLGTLVPVIGLVQVGSQGMADRYTYISFIGLFVLLVWGIAEMDDKKAKSKPRLAIAASVVLVVCAAATWSQIGYWKNSVRLFEHASRATEANFLAYLNFGLAFNDPGNLVEEEYNLRKAIRLRPNVFRAHVSLGNVLFQKGDVSDAYKEFSMVRKIVPNDVENYACLANLFENCEDMKFHDLRKAVEFTRRACELTHYRRRDLLIFLAEVCGNNGDFREATEAARKALVLSVSPREMTRVKEMLVKIHEMESKPKETR